jgi:histidyl-tRNA synthetase
LGSACPERAITRGMADVVFIPLDEACALRCLPIARELRGFGVSCTVAPLLDRDRQRRRLKKRIADAVADRAYFAVVLGPDDLEAGTAQVSDLDEHGRWTLSLAELVPKLAFQVLGSAQYEAAKLERECRAASAP